MHLEVPLKEFSLGTLLSQRSVSSEVAELSPPLDLRPLMGCCLWGLCSFWNLRTSSWYLTFFLFFFHSAFLKVPWLCLLTFHFALKMCAFTFILTY